MMKRILLLLLSVSLAAAGFSQGFNREMTFKLAEIRSSDEVELEQFSYNDDVLLQAVQTLTEYGIELIDSLTYDAAKNIVKLDIYQLMNGVWKHVSYIDYTYDENGNRLTRSNYNSYGSEVFTLGGVYHYFYNAANQQTNWDLYMGGTDLMQLCTLTYNDNGKVVLEIGQDSFNSGVMEDSWKIDYQYNLDGTMKKTFQSFWSGFNWDVYGTELFTYDENKNCIKWEHKNGNTITDKKEYEYNLEYASDQLFMPVYPEFDIKDLVERNNMVTVQHWYTENDVGNLVYVCDYNYKYDTLTYTGNTRYAYDAVDLRMYPNPTSDELTITGNNAVINELSVVDNAGKLVMKKSLLNMKETKLDVTTLKSGVYYIKLSTSKGVVVEKLVKQQFC